MNKKEIFKNYITTQYSNYDYKLDREVFRKKIMQTFPELNDLVFESKILELGCGMGNFAYTCDILCFHDYTGVDLSDEEINLCRKDFPEYKFVLSDIIKFLKKDKNKYDLIFMSQVFEHLTIDEGAEILDLIYSHLNKGGMFINAMPNANSYYNAGQCMFNDITHRRIYNQISFSQLLKLRGITNFEHRNTYMGNNKLQNLIHRVYLKFFEYHLKLLGYARWSIYTHCINTIVRKE